MDPMFQHVGPLPPAIPDYKELRAKQFGVLTSFQNSFELNQSFPRLKKNKKESKYVTGLGKFTGKEVNACTYSQDYLNHFLQEDIHASDFEKSFSSCVSRNSSRTHSRLSLGASWSFNSFIDSSEKVNLCDITPTNKAVITIDADTSRILTANSNACSMFGYTSGLSNVKLTSLFNKPHSNPMKEAILHDIHDTQGNEVVVSGKVMEAVTKQDEVFAVSVWARRIEGHTEQPRCIVILQPVARVVGNFQFNQQGMITSCDENFCHIHGYPLSSTLVDTPIHQYIPSLLLPNSTMRKSRKVRKQQVTSITADGRQIPISVYIHQENDSNQAGTLYNASVWYFTDINGMLTCNLSGRIEHINPNF
uniref:PAS domain-containing protein n=1 Tax=Ciona savignyi TaxID=51511 RepID=H2ZHI9_CIOSA